MESGQADSGDTGTIHRIAIVDNDPMVLMMFSHLIRQHDDVQLAWTATNGVDALQRFHRSMAGIKSLPDLMLVDMSMRGMTGIELSATIRTENGTMPILGITAYASKEYQENAAKNGMQGLVEKDQLHELFPTMRQLVNGEVMPSHTDYPFETPDEAFRRISEKEKERVVRLSNNERLAMLLYMQGVPIQEIAERMDVRPTTVKTYFNRVKRKFGVTTLREARAQWGMRVNL